MLDNGSFHGNWGKVIGNFFFLLIGSAFIGLLISVLTAYVI